MAPQNTKRTERSTAFYPGSDQITGAVEEYLKSGGRITRYVDYDDEFEHFTQGGSYRPLDNHSGGVTS